MNKDGITLTHLIVRIVIIIIILLTLFFVSFGMIKLIPKAFSYISGLNSNLVSDLTQNKTASSSTNSKIPSPQTQAQTQTSSTTPANLSVVFTSSNINSNELGTITFNVTNTGGQDSGSWKFSATLPRSSGETSYDSGYQTNIPARKTSIMTFTFDNAKSGTATINLNGKTFTTQIN
ncbi:MAG: hypothetical protein WC629_00170 [Candidatus Paceibacterota bacterium]|jgi:hypothetical protein